MPPGDKKELNFDPQGLSSSKAGEKLKEFGPNILPEKPPPSDVAIFLAQLKNPLVYVLLAAGVVTLVLNHFSDAVIIGFAVVVNTILGFVQERRANNALTALKKLIHPEAKVVRDGKEIQLDVSQIVPGDLVILEQGTKVPADGRLVEANRLFISEAILTGESVAVAKDVKDPVFMGTIISAGQAKMLVEVTGRQTEIGKIALEIQAPEEDTPLRRQLAKVSRQLSVLVAILTALVFAVSLLVHQQTLEEAFTTSVALAVSAIPEGLLVALTVVLAIGMQRILKEKGLVRNLVSAETLGGVTTICVDKTGTLTQGEMQVVDVEGDENDLAIQAVLANDLDDPIVIAAWEWARTKQSKNLLKEHLRLDSIPFSSENRFFASLNKWSPEENMIFVNGAPEFLLKWSNLEKSRKKEIEKKIEELTAQGKRIVGLARRKVSDKKIDLKEADVQADLEWVGALSFSDPARSGVKEALESAQKAGIELIVITGDYTQTALSVMEQLGIKIEKNCVFLGDELKDLTSDSLAKKIGSCSGVKLFARTTPEQKLKIVEALKENNEVVAMMGDGVNDAPALARADIGIVVGEATDVAKETADLVLLDSSFTTIVHAIEEGRGIFDNIRKIILYLMSDAFEEIIAVIGTLILGLPLPISAAQILWINLISDGFPDLALTVDPKTGGIMEKPPRSPKESLISGWMKELIGVVSLSGGLMALGLFIFFYHQTQDLILARSIAFATLGVNSLIYVFSVRTLTEPFWVEKPFENRWLNLAVLGGFGFQLVPFFFEPTRQFLNLAPLAIQHWLAVFSASLIMFIMIEVNKAIFKPRLARRKKMLLVKKT